MQFALRDDSFGLNTQFTASINKDIAKLFGISPVIEGGIMIFVNREGYMIFNIKMGNSLITIRGLCSNNAQCGHSNYHCYAGLCLPKSGLDGFCTNDAMCMSPLTCADDHASLTCQACVDNSFCQGETYCSTELLRTDVKRCAL